MKKVKIMSFLMVALMLVLSITMSFSAFSADVIVPLTDDALSENIAPLADDAFESEIAAFPESYKPYLRELHATYPDWTFVPMKTGLTFDAAISGESNKNTNKQSDKISLVSTSASNIFKSYQTYDYTQSTDTFKQWDGGFVAANRLAVSYFMDPRNFLTEENIFQFELLSFDDRMTVEAVEAVLVGSFMSNTKITYYNSNGDKKTISKTYGEAIHEAGEKYNINPCYLASKILNEVGTKGSSSVTGKHSTYPGIYNFYNIGANDGGDAISKGLKWASTSGSYSRPWNTPVKSINGGAEFLAETYIKNGQFTGYLQRFNVNPDAYHKLFTHQYMTNLTGALSQGYTTYTSYAKNGLLYNSYIFSIPVYEDMPETDTANSFMTDSVNQYGKISVDGSYVRTGPSTYNAKLTDNNGSVIKLPKGTALTILEKLETDTEYYASILNYPYWYKVEFEYNSYTYTGYVSAGYTDITTRVCVATGNYDISFIRGNESAELSLMSLDESIIEVIDSDTVSFKKEGTATLVAYDSTGSMSKVVFTVKSKASLSPVSDLAASTGSKKVKITFTKGESETELILSDYKGGLVETVATTDETYTFKSLVAGGKYTVAARSKNGKKYSGSSLVSFAIAPEKVTGVTATVNENGETVLSWKAVNATGYVLYCYDGVDGEAVKMGTVKGKTTYTIPEKYSSYSTFSVRSYVNFNSKNTYGTTSDKLTTIVSIGTPEDFAVSNLKETGFTLSWSLVKDADGYELCSVTDEAQIIINSNIKTEYTVSKLKAGAEKIYKIRAYRESGDNKLYSDYSSELTVVTPPEKLSGLKKSAVLSDMVKIAWSASAGADEYEVYLRKGNEAEQYLGAFSKTEATAEGLLQNTDYRFRVVPVAVFGEVREMGKEADVTVTTYLSIPENISASFKDLTTATLSWDKNAQAESYEIYRFDESENNFTLYKVVSTNSLELKYLIPEKEYRYKIRAVGKKNDGTENRSILSDEISVRNSIPAYKGELSAGSVTDDSFRLFWNSAEDVLYYNIYEVVDDEYQKVAKTTQTSYTFSDMGVSYVGTYAVSAVYEILTGDYESEKSEPFTVSTKPSKVKNLKATVSPDSATVKWSKVTNASYYKVYLYDSAQKKYVEKKKLTGTSYTLSSLGYGKSHKVRVRAYIKTDAGTVYSGLTQVDFTTKPKDISSVSLSSATTTTQTLKWSKSTGATHYLVYRYNSSTESYKKLATVTGTSYTVKSLKTKTKYTYKIKPVVMKDGKTVVSGNATKAYKFSTK